MRAIPPLIYSQGGPETLLSPGNILDRTEALGMNSLSLALLLEPRIENLSKSILTLPPLLKKEEKPLWQVSDDSSREQLMFPRGLKKMSHFK